MVEYDDPSGPGRLLHQPLALGIVDRGDGRLVVEIGRGGLVAQQDEALVVERQRIVDRARVANGDVVFGQLAVAGRHARRRVVIVGIGLLRHGLHKVERRHDASQIHACHTIHRILHWRTLVVRYFQSGLDRDSIRSVAGPEAGGLTVSLSSCCRIDPTLLRPTGFRTQTPTEPGGAT